MEKCGAATDLGDFARKTIQGHDFNYDLNLPAEVHEPTLAEFRKRDDNWLRTVDQTRGLEGRRQPLQGFRVCEHASNHNGQIKFLAKRLPGAKASNE